MIYEFTFRLEPKSHADATMFGKGHAYTPTKKKNYQSACLNSFQAKEKYSYPIEGPLMAFWIFYMPRTQALQKKFPELNLYHSTKPDGDGLGKVVQDLVQTGKVSHKAKKSRPRLGIIRNDSQLTLTCLEKTYVKAGQAPHIKLILCQPTKTAPLTKHLLQALLA